MSLKHSDGVKHVTTERTKTPWKDQIHDPPEEGTITVTGNGSTFTDWQGKTWMWHEEFDCYVRYVCFEGRWYMEWWRFDVEPPNSVRCVAGVETESGTWHMA